MARDGWGEIGVRAHLVLGPGRGGVSLGGVLCVPRASRLPCLGVLSDGTSRGDRHGPTRVGHAEGPLMTKCALTPIPPYPKQLVLCYSSTDGFLPVG